VVKGLKSEKVHLDSTVALLTTRLDNATSENQRLHHEIEDLKLNQSKELSNITLLNTQEMAKQRETFLSERDNQRIQNENHVHSLMNKFEIETKQLNEKLNQLTANLQNETQRKEALNRELIALKDKYDGANSELLKVKMDYERTYGSKTSQEQTINSLESKIQSLAKLLAETEKNESIAVDKASKYSEKTEILTQQLVPQTNLEAGKGINRNVSTSIITIRGCIEKI
jgi:chromosome segregation ATPase